MNSGRVSSSLEEIGNRKNGFYSPPSRGFMSIINDFTSTPSLEFRNSNNEHG